MTRALTLKDPALMRRTGFNSEFGPETMEFNTGWSGVPEPAAEPNFATITFGPETMEFNTGWSGVPEFINVAISFDTVTFVEDWESGWGGT